MLNSSCSVDNCETHNYAKGLCKRHYRQMQRHGEILKHTRFEGNLYYIRGSRCFIKCFDIDGNSVGFAIIDIEDMEKCKLHIWHISSGGYVCCTRPMLRLHNYVLDKKTSRKTPVDHINRNTLDCTKANLRVVTASDNKCNSGIYKNNTSGYKGVHPHRNKWRARIRKNGEIVHLGIFAHAEDAAIAYNQAALKLHGTCASLNKIAIKEGVSYVV